jgi:hypothetical protein
MTKHYIEFVYPGIMFSESSSKEIEHRDAKKVELPKGAVGFRFFDKEQTELDGETLEGKPKNYTGWRYKGRELTLEDVKREMPGERILISNMECNNWDKVVKLECGQIFPLCKEDMVIENEEPKDIVDELREE